MSPAADPMADQVAAAVNEANAAWDQFDRAARVMAPGRVEMSSGGDPAPRLAVLVARAQRYSLCPHLRRSTAPTAAVWRHLAARVDCMRCAKIERRRVRPLTCLLCPERSIGRVIYQFGPAIHDAMMCEPCIRWFEYPTFGQWPSG